MIKPVFLTGIRIALLVPLLIVGIANGDEVPQTTSPDPLILPQGKINVRYPKDIAIEWKEGIVVLAIKVLEDGTVGDVDVLMSHGIFDKFVVDAARRTRFKAGTVNGKPVAMLYYHAIRFKSENDEQTAVGNLERIARKAAYVDFQKQELAYYEELRKVARQEREQRFVAAWNATGLIPDQRMLWQGSSNPTNNLTNDIVRFFNEINLNLAERLSNAKKKPVFVPPSKGEFEKTTDYDTRERQDRQKFESAMETASANIANKQLQIRNTTFNDYFGTPFVRGADYDADKEYFKVKIGSDTSPLNIEATISIPPAEAENLKTKIVQSKPSVFLAFVAGRLSAKTVILELDSIILSGQVTSFTESPIVFGEPARQAWLLKLKQQSLAAEEMQRKAAAEEKQREEAKNALARLDKKASDARAANQAAFAAKILALRPVLIVRCAKEADSSSGCVKYNRQCVINFMEACMSANLEPYLAPYIDLDLARLVELEEQGRRK